MAKEIKQDYKQDQLTRVLLFIYLIVLAWIILFKMGVSFSYMEERRINLIPFANGYYSLTETIMNVVIFIPLGLYAGILFRRKTFAWVVLFFFLVSLIVESLQVIIKTGTFDITDLLTNTTGGIIGYLFIWLFEKIASSPLKVQKIINILASLSTVIIISLLALLKLNMLPVRFQ